MEPIDAGTGRMMIAAAVVVDIFAYLAGLGFLDFIIDIPAAMIFGMWFSHYGVSVVQKRPLGFFGTVLAKFIPFIDLIPFWTYFVVTTIRQSRTENDGL
jgi:hypothetical protein